MFDYLKKLKRSLSNPDRQRKSNQRPLSKSLKENIDAMKAIFCNDNDFIVRVFTLPVSESTQIALFFIDGLASGQTINEAILRPLLIDTQMVASRKEVKIESIAALCDAFLLSGEIETGTTYDKVCEACLMGDTVVMMDGCAEFFYISSKGFEKRSVTEPQTETVVRGPREGFTEVLRTNSALLRRKMKTPSLRMEVMSIGKRTHTSVCLAYLDTIANPELVKEVKKRLQTIDTDAILSSGYIEEYIDDAPLSVFPTIYYSEKPDIVAAQLLEGRCALIIEGTPFVLVMPMLFVECFQSPEDYSIGPFIAIFLRVIRLISFFISLTAPAIYVALTAFHQELIPTALLFTIAASSEGVPFNSIFEAIIMLLTFEILKEAGIRLPKPVGQAVSIVGALVMGQAAIEAGVVGSPVVIVIAFTAVTSFLIPYLSDATTLLRWYLLILSSILGGYGIILGLLTILFHLASLESFGAMYLYPYSPLNLVDMKDSIIRMPLWKMRTRPKILKPQDMVRQNMDRCKFGQDGDET